MIVPPLKVVVPVTVRLPPIPTLPVVVIESMYASLKYKELVPISMSLSETGAITPFPIYNCCTELLESSIQNSIWSFDVSINTLFKGVTNPASPTTPITGPSAAVPSCLCPVSL